MVPPLTLVARSTTDVTRPGRKSCNVSIAKLKSAHVPMAARIGCDLPWERQYRQTSSPNGTYATTLNATSERMTWPASMKAPATASREGGRHGQKGYRLA